MLDFTSNDDNGPRPRPTLPIVDHLYRQPRPLQWLVARLGGITAVTRIWEPGATFRCSLCRECHADHVTSTCMLLYRGEIPTAQAALVTDRGLPRLGVFR